MNPNDQRKLEQFVSEAVHGLPSRRAPSSLESRVQAEIARRAAQPWWRKSFLNWPLGARAVFVVVCGLVVRFALLAISTASKAPAAAQVKTSFESELVWLRAARALGESLAHSLEAIVGGVPSLWLYGGAAVLVALYVALFGLGAAAYRTLYASR